jgi:hypothetical protein
MRSAMWEALGGRRCGAVVVLACCAIAVGGCAGSADPATTRDGAVPKSESSAVATKSAEWAVLLKARAADGFVPSTCPRVPPRLHDAVCFLRGRSFVLGPAQFVMLMTAFGATPRPSTVYCTSSSKANRPHPRVERCGGFGSLKGHTVGVTASSLVVADRAAVRSVSGDLPGARGASTMAIEYSS